MRNYLNVKNIAIVALMALTGVLLPACGGGKTHPTDTLTVEPDPTPQPAEETMTDAKLGPTGVAPIKVGMRISEVKPSVENLYDSIARESGYESNSYTFLFDGERRFTVYEFETGIVNVVAADDDSVVVEDPTGEKIRLGDPFSKVLAIKDVKPVWESADGEGMWCWTWQGLWFQPDQSALPDVLSHKLYNPTTPPSPSDFNEDVKVGYMGTGLPW